MLEINQSFQISIFFNKLSNLKRSIISNTDCISESLKNAILFQHLNNNFTDKLYGFDSFTVVTWV